MHARADGMANEYWMRLLVRELAEIAIFFYVGLVLITISTSLFSKYSRLESHLCEEIYVKQSTTSPKLHRFQFHILIILRLNRILLLCNFHLVLPSFSPSLVFCFHKMRMDAWVIFMFLRRSFVNRWTFRSRELTPFFTVIPNLHSSGQRILPPIYSVVKPLILLR